MLRQSGVAVVAAALGVVLNFLKVYSCIYVYSIEYRVG